jgi:hypothetical protein
MCFDILSLFCLSLRILWDPWAQDPGPRSDGRIGRTGRTDLYGFVWIVSRPACSANSEHCANMLVSSSFEAAWRILTGVFPRMISSWPNPLTTFRRILMGAPNLHLIRKSLSYLVSTPTSCWNCINNCELNDG